MARTAAEITAEENAFNTSLASLTAWQAASLIRGRFGGSALQGMVDRITIDPAQAVDAAEVAQAIAKLDGAKAALTTLQAKL